jgi:nitroimidazol reductase NimA-like FMN-containing flavoprotein (pyridoxamine 5'-phosphate oxidase superfamily)
MMSGEDEKDEGWRGKVSSLDRQEMDEFLKTSVLCRLAVLDNDDRPHVVPVWFEWEPNEGIFWIIARAKSAWATFILRNPKVGLSIDGEVPYRKVSSI